MERKKKIMEIITRTARDWEKEGVSFYVPRSGFEEAMYLPRGEEECNSLCGPGHVHSYPEIFLQLEEESLFSFGEGDYVLKKGSVLIVPPFTAHPERIGGNRKKFLNLVIVADLHHVNCHIAGARMDRDNPQVREPIFSFTRRGESIVALGKIMIDVYRKGDRALLGDLFRTLAFYLEDIFLSPGENAERYSEKVLSACSHIRVELDNPRLNVDYLSRRMGCSSDYLSHLFHREMGEKLTSYINGERILRAKALLTETQLNCSETAWACGFSSAAYFNRIFREKTGLTPKEYKNRR